MIAEAHSTLSRLRYPVTLVGGAARRALGSGWGGSVLATFRHSFYCQSREGSLVCLGPMAIGAGPLNVVCALPEPTAWEAGDLEPGAPVKWDGQALRVDDRFVFSLTGARDWQPAPVPRDWDAGVLAQGLTALEARAAVLAPPDGLGPLIPMLAKGPRSVAVTPLARTARDGIVALAEWARVGEGFPPAAVETLIGLGPGLTPSGDDALGGALIAFRALGRAGIAERLAAKALPRARQRTHAISLAHLACAADGQGTAALHETLAALCSPRARGLSRCLDAIAAIGHTSGWDALVGVWVAAKVTVGDRQCRSEAKS